MKAASAKLMALGCALVISAGAILLLESRPRRAAAESLQVETRMAEEGGRVDLTITWQWTPPFQGRRWYQREHLLAVSFDTRRLVLEQEAAPLGRGANGEMLRRLDQLVGIDGARRHFVIPEGEDGKVALRFRTVRPGVAVGAGSILVYVAFDAPGVPVWTLPIHAAHAPGGPGELRHQRQE